MHGITTQNSMVLRNAGVNVQAGQAMDKYAASLKKGKADLTDSERAQAVLNAVIEAGIPIQGAYAAAMEEPGKVLRSFPRIFDDIKVSVGKPLVDAFGPTILAAYNFAKALSAGLAPGGALNAIIVAIGKKLSDLIGPFTDVIKKMTEWTKAIKPEQIQGIVDAIAKIGPAAGSAGAGVFAMGAKSLPVIGNLLGGINPLVVALGAFALTSSDVRGVLSDLAATIIPLAKELISGLLPAFNAIVKALAPVVAVLLEVASVLVKELLAAITPLLPVIAELVTILGRMLATAITELAPTVSTLVQALLPLVSVFIRLAGEGLVELLKLIEPLLPLLVYLVPLFLAWKVATLAVAAAQTLMNIVLTANPIGIIVVAIAALVAGLILAYQKMDWFRTAVNAVGAAVAAVFNWIKANWPLLAAILTGPFGIAVVLIVKNFDTIKGAATAAFDAVKGAVQSAIGWITANWPLILAVLTGPFGLAVLAITRNFDSIVTSCGACPAGSSPRSATSGTCSTTPAARSSKVSSGGSPRRSTPSATPSAGSPGKSKGSCRSPRRRRAPGRAGRPVLLRQSHRRRPGRRHRLERRGDGLGDGRHRRAGRHRRRHHPHRRRPRPARPARE